MQGLVVRRDSLRAMVWILTSCLLIAFSATGNASTEVGEPNLKIGNYWTYSFDMTADDMTIEGTVTMEMIGIEDEQVDGKTQNVFVLASTGELQISGSYLEYDVTGSGTIGGTDVRLCSSFDLARSAFAMSMDYTMSSSYGMDITVAISTGYDVEYTPALNDYVGDDDILTGAEMTDLSHIQGSAWVDYLGTNETDPVDGDIEYVMTVVDDVIEKDTVAGSFSCCRVDVDCTGAMNQSGTNYYSVEAGNYVVMGDESAHYLGMLNGLTLVDYSYSPDGVPPVADAGEDLTVKVGEELEFNGTGSSDNVGVTNYTWELTRDGNTTYLYGSEPVHVFDSKGVYTVNLTVSDGAGNAANDSVTVTVKDDGVLAYFIGDQMWVGLTLIAVLVGAALAVTILSRRRKRAGPTTVPPPPQPAFQPPIQEQPPPQGAP